MISQQKKPKKKIVTVYTRGGIFIFEYTPKA